MPNPPLVCGQRALFYETPQWWEMRGRKYLTYLKSEQKYQESFFVEK
jgi:hypothetical protein